MKKEEVLNLFKRENINWDKFVEWMSGQTMGLDEDGETIFYEDDVLRYIGIVKYGRKDIWD